MSNLKSTLVLADLLANAWPEEVLIDHLKKAISDLENKKLIGNAEEIKEAFSHLKTSCHLILMRNTEEEQPSIEKLLEDADKFE